MVIEVYIFFFGLGILKSNFFDIFGLKEEIYVLVIIKFLELL